MLSTSISVDTVEADNSDFNRSNINTYIKTGLESPYKLVQLDNFTLASSLYLLDPYPLTPVDDAGFFLLRENLPNLFTPPVETNQEIIFSNFLVSSMDAMITRILSVNSAVNNIEINLKRANLSKPIILEILSVWHKVALILYAQNKKAVASKLLSFAYKNLLELIEDYQKQECFPQIAESYAFTIYDYVTTPPIFSFEQSISLINQAALILSQIPQPYSPSCIHLYCMIQATRTQLLMCEAIRLMNLDDLHLKSIAFNYYDQSIANNNSNLLILSDQAISAQNEYITKMITFTEAAVANNTREHNIYLYKNILREYTRLPANTLNPAQLASTTHYHKALARIYREQGDALGFQPQRIAEAQENYRLAMDLFGQIPAQYKLNDDMYEQEYCNRSYALFSLAALLDPKKQYPTEDARQIIGLCLKNNNSHLEFMNEIAQQNYFQHQHKFTHILVQYAELILAIDDKATAAACYEAAVHELNKIPVNLRWKNENEKITEWERKIKSYLQTLPISANSIYTTSLTTFGTAPSTSESRVNDGAEVNIVRTTSAPGLN